MYPTTTPPLVLNERLPDPAIKALDKSFEKYRLPLASVERLSQGFSWAEGPVYFGDARCLLWSDIPNSRIMRWDEETGQTSVYRKPSNYANGNTRDRQGRLVTAEHGRRVTRTEYDGRITVLMDRFDGKRLNSPNDIVVKSDGSIWFTDMDAGITGNWNGETGRVGAATVGLPDRRQDRAGDGGDLGRGEAAERARLLARREEALYRGIRHRAARDLRL